MTITLLSCQLSRLNTDSLFLSCFLLDDEGINWLVVNTGMFF